MRMKLFFFDLETTGIMPSRNGIHQISGQIVIDGRTMETFNYHVRPNPKARIDEEALRVGGVTLEHITSYPPMEEIHTRLTEMLGRYVDKYDRLDKFFLVGYNNASFDNDFLRGFFKQSGDNFFGSWFWSNCLDVMVLASHHLTDKRPSMPDFKLSTVAATLGVTVNSDDLHDAAYDIVLTRAVYDAVGGKY